MFISIDPETKTASIQEPEVLTAFHIESPEHNEDAVASIIGNGAEAAEDAHVWVSIEWITRNVEGEVSSNWKEDFSGMVQYATSKGGVNESETHLKAHIKVD